MGRPVGVSLASQWTRGLGKHRHIPGIGKPEAGNPMPCPSLGTFSPTFAVAYSRSAGLVATNQLVVQPAASPEITGLHPISANQLPIGVIGVEPELGDKLPSDDHEIAFICQ